ncbi:Aste57867_22301 [Aphanomyces stellatus]|uniref:Aste57867_22301 protein n=1 Tax=Aphanomyces stellatus TaxID=120398 RepID=A0A485LJQ7_9STRA|nr:hypothetical protein As57867_022231 [Aphanomyces stellatus]VFT98965.1 Aste57867_22301 [Aphanomyces stellatus]
MTLSHSNGSFRLAGQTMFQMYWSLASDLWAINANATSIHGQSLIRASDNDAFANVSMRTVLVGNGTLKYPLGMAFTLIQHHIGPFGSIDMITIPCPASVKTFLATGLDFLRRSVASSATAASTYASISATYSNDIQLSPVPTLLALNPTWSTVGGSLLCPECGAISVSVGLLQLTSRMDACGKQVMSLLQPTFEIMLLGGVGVGLGHTLNSVDVGAINTHQTKSGTDIQDMLTQFATYLQPSILSNDDGIHLDTTQRHIAEADAQALNVSILQYVQQNASSPVQLMTFPLFDPTDPSFFYWSWLYALEWATSDREVVTFQGDVGTINVITECAMPVYQPVQTHELPTIFSLYARSAVQYVTGVLLSIVLGVLLYTVWCRGRVNGLNLFLVNRVAGVVWVGRPLLLLRGITALALLSTASLELTLTHSLVTGFVVPTVPWYKVVLSGGEATWLVYILDDLLMAWTKEHTQLHSSWDALLVWAVVGVFTQAQPVVHSASIDPTCQIDEMDFQLVCASGRVTIGQVTRLYTLLGIKRRKVKEAPESVLLSAGAKYLFDWSPWVRHGVAYVDPASALLNGLVVVLFRRKMYAMDIKMWRVVAVDMQDDDSIEMAFPLFQ